jgi:phosphoribosyl-AMP cyclohydrolase
MTAITDAAFEKIKSQIKFNASTGLVPAIIQDAKTQKVLTLCYLNDSALRATLETGFVHLFRRSQNKLMKKGETSGHTQAVREIRPDCDGNSLLIVIDQHVAGCHAGYFSCYFEKFENDGAKKVTDPIVFDPKKVY